MLEISEQEKPISFIQESEPGISVADLELARGDLDLGEDCDYFDLLKETINIRWAGLEDSLRGKFVQAFKDQNRTEKKALLKHTFSQCSTFDAETIDRGIDYMLE